MDSFWNHLPKPIVGLSAMDGVTDAAMREITASIGHPDFMVTEFTSADGIVRGISRLLRDFYYTPNQRPIVAQIFGTDPESFRISAIICCFLGFDGIDINMGCPAESVAHRGGGASLIKNPPLAKKLIKSVQKGVEDYINGIKLEELGLPMEFIQKILHRSSHENLATRNSLPVSVKTRIGYDKPITREWISHLLETEPDLITVHGRILEHHYANEANWEEIKIATDLIHQTKTLIFGNGDIKSLEDVAMRVKESGVDGVWIGRAAMGNPWIFTGKEPTTQERFAVALKHARIFEEINRTVFADDPLPFLNMRKHLGWYVKGFRDASDMRLKLFQTNNSQEVEKVFVTWNDQKLN